MLQSSKIQEHNVMGVKVGTKWRKYESTKNIVFLMYFLHLVPLIWVLWLVQFGEYVRLGVTRK